VPNISARDESTSQQEMKARRNNPNPQTTKSLRPRVYLNPNIKF